MVGVWEVAMPPTIVAMSSSGKREAKGNVAGHRYLPASETNFAYQRSNPSLSCAGVRARREMPRIFAMLMVAAGWCAPTAARAELPALRPIVAGDSILVVAPHPDDESLCCAGLMYTARLAGAKVSVVWVTFGDGFRWSAMVDEHRFLPRKQGFIELAARRESEARAAARVLQLDPQSLYFLGYPDRGVLPMLLDHYYPNTPWRSRFTGAREVTYADAITPGAAFDGENLERDFLRVLELVKPTLVLAPSPQDTHPDHRGTGILAWR